MANRSSRLMILLLASLALLTDGCTRENAQSFAPPFPRLTGDYLGQTPPGDEPELFAPGIVSTGLQTRDFTISPDGDEIYFCAAIGNHTHSTILVSRRESGVWTEPEVAPFASHAGFMYIEPFMQPDGERLFFVSDQPDPRSGTEGGDEDIWYCDRTPAGWNEPRALGAPVNSADAEYFPSVTNDGTIYFTREDRQSRQGGIFRTRLVDGVYQEPERLPEQVNSTPYIFNAFVAPDESYLIVPVFGREDSHGHADYYICFRSPDDQWSDPINLGETINTDQGNEWSPYVSPDGQYFFFMSARPREDVVAPGGAYTREKLFEMHNRPGHGLSSIYWMRAGFIELLRTQAG